MLSRRQKEYLEAMGIDTWSLREPASVDSPLVDEATAETAAESSPENQVQPEVVSRPVPDQAARETVFELTPEVPVELPATGGPAADEAIPENRIEEVPVEPLAVDMSQPDGAIPDIAAEMADETRPDAGPGLKLGPGRGGVLLVCAQDSDSASKLANDIGRALGSVPVWSWPDDDPAAVKLTDAVEENLFTTVAIFGDELAQTFFAGDLPASVHAARLVCLPPMREIRDRPEARRTLWTVLCRSGMVNRI